MEVFIFCFNMKKSAAETHRMLSNPYGEAELLKERGFERSQKGDCPR